MENNSDGVAFKGVGSVTGGIAFSAAVIVYIFVCLIFSLICSATGFNGGTADEVNSAYVYLNYLLAPLAVAVSLPVVLKIRRTPFKRIMPLKISPAKAGVKWYGVALLLAFGLLFSLCWLNIGFEELLELFGYESSRSYYPDLSGGRVALAILVMAVVPAICEETLFRGALLQNIREEAGELNSVFLCGMCFALFHASALQTFYQFVCGCVFALLTIRSGSVAPAILVHFLNNAVLIVLQACGLDTSATIFDWVPLWAAILVTALSAIALAGGLLVLILDKTPFKAAKKGGVKYFFIAAEAGIFALAVLWIAGLF